MNFTVTEMKAKHIPQIALLEKECCGRISGDDVRNAPTINPDNLTEALAMQHDIALENVRRTGRKIGLGILSHNS